MNYESISKEWDRLAEFHNLTRGEVSGLWAMYYVSGDSGYGVLLDAYRRALVPQRLCHRSLWGDTFAYVRANPWDFVKNILVGLAIVGMVILLSAWGN